MPRSSHLLITFLFSIACNRTNEISFTDRDPLSYQGAASMYQANSVVTIDVQKTDEIIRISNVIDPDHQIIKLETTDNCLIGEISKIIIDQGRIYILDSKISKQLFCFDISGKFLYRVGTFGGGPQEMDNPKDFEVTTNSILIIDRQCRVFSYDKTGNYLKVFRAPFLTTQICAFDSSSIFFYSNSITNNKHYLTEVEGSEVQSVNFPIQSQHVESYGIPQAFNRNDDKALFVKFLCDTIFSLSKNRLSPEYLITFPTKLPTSVFKDENELQKVFNNTNAFWRLGQMNMTHTNSDLFFMSFGEKVYHHYFNRSQFKHKMSYRISDDYFFGGIAANPPVGNYEDYFIYPISMPPLMAAYQSTLSDFNAKMDKDEIEDFKKKFSDFMLLCSKSSEEDNPALLLTKINPKLYAE